MAGRGVLGLPSNQSTAAGGAPTRETDDTPRWVRPSPRDAELLTRGGKAVIRHAVCERPGGPGGCGAGRQVAVRQVKRTDITVWGAGGWRGDSLLIRAKYRRMDPQSPINDPIGSGKESETPNN